MTIALNDMLKIEEPAEYKLHLACWNGESHPLDEFVADPANWPVLQPQFFDMMHRDR